MLDISSDSTSTIDESMMVTADMELLYCSNPGNNWHMLKHMMLRERKATDTVELSLRRRMRRYASKRDALVVCSLRSSFLNSSNSSVVMF